MLRPVEVCHEGRWLPATLMATRLEDDGWHGLVGFTHPSTREGFYRWVPESVLRDAEVVPPAAGTFVGRGSGT
ncbi:hypothetical protein [Longivirga aurantiaca]|uniref:Uncharacterized protein n=1 Tax=Longivirga aurantiaca TaxID=1837743 RepID=A0ABW1SYU8_9ACTN